MTRSQFLGLLTLPFLTRFGKKEEPKYFPKGELQSVGVDPVREYPLTHSECYDGLKSHPYIADEAGMFPIQWHGEKIKKGDMWLITDGENSIKVCEIIWDDDKRTHALVKYKA